MLSEDEYIEVLIFQLLEKEDLDTEDFLILAGYAWEQLLALMRSDGIEEDEIRAFLDQYFQSDWSLAAEEDSDGIPCIVIRFDGEEPDYE
jgi:hypothetical protein